MRVVLPRQESFQGIRPEVALSSQLVSVDDHDRSVTNSEPPKIKKHRGIALTPAQQKMVIDVAASPWCLRAFSVANKTDGSTDEIDSGDRPSVAQ